MFATQAKVTVKTTVEITKRQIVDAIITGVETGYAGIGYWCKKVTPFGLDGERCQWIMIYGNDGWDITYGEQECEVGSISFDENEGNTINVSLYDSEMTDPHSRVSKGLQLMADQSPILFADLINGNDDVTTADVLIQYICFGEIRYG